MIVDPTAFIGRRTRIAERLLWSAAVLAVSGAHVGLAAWLLHDPAIEPAPANPPAIMVEFSPESTSQEVQQEQEIQPDKEMQEQAANMADAPDRPSEEVVEPEPVEETSETTKPIEVAEVVPQEAEPIEDITETVLEEVEVPVPLPRPTPPKQKESAPQKKTAPAPRSTAPPKVETRKANRTAATQSTRGRPSPRISPARWPSLVVAHIERFKRYPAEAQSHQGMPYVRFTIDDSGQITGARLSRSSGSAALDQAALNTVRRSSPVPAPPPGVQRTLTVPIRFSNR
ncbi:MAG: TonB family protein [Methyloligella sp. ZOD6]